MKTLYFFLIIFFISCNKKLLITERNKDVEIEIDFVILNKKIKFGDSIIIKVYNNSNNNYYLPIDFLNKGFNPYIDKNIEKSFYPEFISNNIIGFRKKMQSANNFHENKTLKDFYYFNELNNFFLIKQKGTKILKIPFNQHIVYNVYYNIESKGRFDLKLNYDINKDHVKSYLKEDVLKKLDSLGYQCYHGKIESNTVPFIIR